MMVGDVKVKAVVIGDSGVGKTSFVQTCKKGMYYDVDISIVLYNL
jgi:GTPase SAR1 family protein